MSCDNWATLTRCDKDDDSAADSQATLKLTALKFSFGRSTDCDVSFTDNKLLSNYHCHIEKDEDSNFWLVDTSTNGTFINFSLHVKKKKYLLKDGDKLSLVLKKKQTEKNISFVFKTNLKRTLTGSNDSVEKKSRLDSTESEVVSKKPLAKDENDNYADILTCTVCLELFHDCVSLQPCLHSFCSSCYSEWMEESDLCPICRVQVIRISKNHTIGKLIEKYIENNPDKARSKEILAELDSKNKITHDMLYPKIEQEKEEEYMESSSDSDEDANTVYFLNTEISNQTYQPRCQQCLTDNTVATVSEAAGFTCTNQQNHLMCQCCYEFMPERSDFKQQCDICCKIYCNLYWRCKSPGCSECLLYLPRLKIKNTGWTSTLINNNQYESELFNKYLTLKKLSIQTVFEECIDEYKSGNYTLTKENALEAAVCRECGFKLFQELAYQYRSHLSSDEIFKGDENKRTDCKWGKHCRTQKHNPEHAKKYNHICEMKEENI